MNCDDYPPYAPIPIKYIIPVPFIRIASLFSLPASNNLVPVPTLTVSLPKYRFHVSICK